MNINQQPTVAGGVRTTLFTLDKSGSIVLQQQFLCMAGGGENGKINEGELVTHPFRDLVLATYF